MELEKGTTLHGFTVRYSQPLPELKATLYRMEYVKNGADLVWLDRPDDNKTFSIAFKTIPSDHTGVFHILEHSVLCGSRKYPVREPFVELLKSSLQTFLNAMTFPDKTMYPVASRNDRDFLNLVDVYMDAVLHPLSAESPLGFKQEGWHYELDAPDGELVRNGVVYNEMKGAYVDPNSVLGFELGLRLYPDNCYRFESGGHPDHIPELTYEKYLENHRRFYHPSNAYIFLDGEVDLDAVLSKLDSFLREYDRIDVDADIPFQKPVNAGETTAYYEIGPEDDGSDKVLVGQGWVYGQYDKPELSFAASILAQALCGTNESPLMKAILDAGLAQDVSLYNVDGTLQHSLNLTVQNTSAEKKDELLRTVRQVLEEQSRGLDHQQLHAILNQVEFANREKDFGRMPRGLVFAMISLESWLYGGDPAQNLDNTQIFKSLRAKIDEGWFENFLREITLDNPHTATVVLLPSKTLGEEKRARDAKELAAIKAGWDEKKIGEVMDEFNELRRHQSEADTPEDLATLPILDLKDIPEKMETLPYAARPFEGTTLLTQDVETGGITYLSLHFAADDLSMEELTALPTLCSLIGTLSTANHTGLEISGLIREKLGRAAVTPNVYFRPSDGRVLPTVEVSAALLPHRKADALELLRELLLTTSYADSAAVYNNLRQSRIGAEQTAMNAGNAFAYVRASAGLSAHAAVADALRGITQLRWLQRVEKDFEGAGLCDKLAALAAKLFIRERVTLSVTGGVDEKWLSDILNALPHGAVGERVKYAPVERESEGFSIPAGIGFAATAARLPDVGVEFDGSMSVAAKLLGLDYLWNNVRVKGGAYGVNMGVDDMGSVSFTSYRDPQCGGTLDIFAGAGQVLRDFADSGEALDKYIISTIGSMEPVMTPRQEAARAAALYFTGRTQESLQQVRSEVLRTDRAALRAFGDTLDKLLPVTQTCVIAGQPILDACGSKLRSVEPIQK